MPALLNIAANLIFGGVIALVARHSSAQMRSALAWPLLCLVGFEAIIFTPVATYLFRFYPQWSMLYWFDPQLFPELEGWVGWLAGLAVLGNIAAALLGYVVSRWGIVHSRTWFAALPAVLGGGAVAYLIAEFGDHIGSIGDYDAFWSGSAPRLIDVLPGWIGIAVYLGAFFFAVWLHSRFGDRDPQLL